MAAAPMEHLTALEALERLVDGIRLARGGVRIRAHFRDGELTGKPTVGVFKVHPYALASVKRGGVDERMLEYIASQLELDRGDCELVAEYEQGSNGLHLRCVDFNWSA